MKSEQGFGVIEILVGALVVGMLGTGATFAADPAVPGDLLYSLDLTIENIQETFTNGDEAKIAFKVEQTEERANELETVRNREENAEIQLEAENNYLTALEHVEQILLQNMQRFRENQPDSTALAPMSRALERIHTLQARVRVDSLDEEDRSGIEIEIEEEDFDDADVENEGENTRKSIRVYEVDEEGTRGVVKIENNGPDYEWTLEEMEEAEPIEMPSDPGEPTPEENENEDEDESEEEGETEPGSGGSEDNSDDSEDIEY